MICKKMLLFSIVISIALIEMSQCGSTYVHNTDCQEAGGVCRVKETCIIPTEDKEYEALCGHYRHDCCLKERNPKKRCISNNGKCKAQCPPIARELTSTDCPRRYYCCLF